MLRRFAARKTGEMKLVAGFNANATPKDGFSISVADFHPSSTILPL